MIEEPQPTDGMIGETELRIINIQLIMVESATDPEGGMIERGRENGRDTKLGRMNMPTEMVIPGRRLEVFLPNLPLPCQLGPTMIQKKKREKFLQRGARLSASQGKVKWNAARVALNLNRSSTIWNWT